MNHFLINKFNISRFQKIVVVIFLYFTLNGLRMFTYRLVYVYNNLKQENMYQKKKTGLAPVQISYSS